MPLPFSDLVGTQLANDTPERPTRSIPGDWWLTLLESRSRSGTNVASHLRRERQAVECDFAKQ